MTRAVLCLFVPFAVGCNALANLGAKPAAPAVAEPGAEAEIVPSNIVLQGDRLHVEVWTKHAPEIEVVLKGPGVVNGVMRPDCGYPDGAGARRCRSWRTQNPGLALLESASFQVDRSKLAAGPYELTVMTPQGPLSTYEFELVDIPTIGGKRGWVVDPRLSARVLTIADQDGILVNLPFDARMRGNHQVFFGWYHDGVRVAAWPEWVRTAYASLDDLDLEVPAFHVSRFVIRNPIEDPNNHPGNYEYREQPLEAAGTYTLVALLDGAVVLGTWDVRFDGKRYASVAGSPEQRRLTADLREALADHRRKTRLDPEPVACALALEPKAVPILQMMAADARQEMIASHVRAGIRSNAEREARYRVGQTAVREWDITPLTSEERAEADRLVAARGHGAVVISGAGARAEAQLKKLSRNHKDGCLARLLGPKVAPLLAPARR